MISPKALLIDALGTMVYLDPPAPHLRREIQERFGVEVSEDEAHAAMRAEIRHYRSNLQRGRDADSLSELRGECAAVLRDALPERAQALPLDELTDALVASLRFEPYDEVLGVLRALRERGHTIVVLSNWDFSLHEMLQRTGITDLVDGAVSSAVHGTAKPDPGIFEHALALAGAQASEAVHVGDSPEADVVGAQAAGIEPIFVAREREDAPAGVRVIDDLTGLLELTR